MADTWISDGDSTCLLRAGADVQMPAEIMNLSIKTYGPTAKNFDAGRFLKPKSKFRKKNQYLNDQKKAFHPFEGGKHLCPGRNIVFAPSIGVVAVLLLAFEVKGKSYELVEVPGIWSVRIGEAVTRPFEDGWKIAAVLRRRVGLKDVVGKFMS